MPQSSDQSANERERFPAHFTFSQRYGYEPLPEPMRLGHLSDALRREVFNAVRQFLLKVERIHNGYRYVSRFTERTLGEFHNVVESEIARLDFEQTLNRFKRCLTDKKSYEFNEVLDLIEIALNTMELVSVDIEIRPYDLKKINS